MIIKFFSENSVILTIISVAIAFIALAQPWAIKLWEKYFRIPKIEIYPSGALDIGISIAGSVIGIHGTLQALNDDVFIKSIRLKIRNLATKEEHLLFWAAFRSPVIYLTQSEVPPMEFPAGFIVSRTQPHRFNIAFYDPELQKELNTVFQPLMQIAQIIAVVDPLKVSVEKAQFRNPSPKVFDKYANTVEYKEVLETFNRKCYWKNGSYLIELIIDTDKGDAKFKKFLTFELTKDDENNLLKNGKLTANNFFRGATGDQLLSLFIAFPNFKEIKET